MPASLSHIGSGSRSGCLHLGHSTRISRWAMIAWIDDGHQERLDAHVDQARDRAGGVVGVQRGEHQVTGEGRLDRDFRHFQVADFADQDDVRRLTQHRAEDLARTSARCSRCTWHWLMPAKLYSTGSSAVMIFGPGGSAR